MILSLTPSLRFSQDNRAERTRLDAVARELNRLLLQLGGGFRGNATRTGEGVTLFVEKGRNNPRLWEISGLEKDSESGTYRFQKTPINLRALPATF